MKIKGLLISIISAMSIIVAVIGFVGICFGAVLSAGQNPDGPFIFIASVVAFCAGTFCYSRFDKHDQL